MGLDNTIKDHSGLPGAMTEVRAEGESAEFQKMQAASKAELSEAPEQSSQTDSMTGVGSDSEIKGKPKAEYLQSQLPTADAIAARVQGEVKNEPMWQLNEEIQALQVARFPLETTVAQGPPLAVLPIDDAFFPTTRSANALTRMLAEQAMSLNSGAGTGSIVSGVVGGTAQGPQLRSAVPPLFYATKKEIIGGLEELTRNTHLFWPRYDQPWTVETPQPRMFDENRQSPEQTRNDLDRYLSRQVSTKFDANDLYKVAREMTNSVKAVSGDFAGHLYGGVDLVATGLDRKAWISKETHDVLAEVDPPGTTSRNMTDATRTRTDRLMESIRKDLYAALYGKLRGKDAPGVFPGPIPPVVPIAPQLPPDTPTAEKPPGYPLHYKAPQPALDDAKKDPDTHFSIKTVTVVAGLGAVGEVNTTFASKYPTPFSGNGALLPNRGAPNADSKLYAESQYNGNVYTTISNEAYAAAKAKAGSEDPALIAANLKDVYYVNGVNTPYNNTAEHPYGSRDQAFELSKLTGSRIIHIANVSDPAAAKMDVQIAGAMALVQTGQWSAIGSTFVEAVTGQSMERAEVFNRITSHPPAFEALQQRIKEEILTNPPAAVALGRQILDDIVTADGIKDIRVIAYSQGGPITVEALRYVDDGVRARYSEGKANAIMANISVLGLGSAAAAADFPKHVKYSLAYDESDPIPRVLAPKSVVDASDGIPPADGTLVSRIAGFQDLGSHLTYFEGYGKEGSKYHEAMRALLPNWMMTSAVSFTNTNLRYPDSLETPLRVSRMATGTSS
jgi:hypothetical protein